MKSPACQTRSAPCRPPVLIRPPLHSVLQRVVPKNQPRPGAVEEHREQSLRCADELLMPGSGSSQVSEPVRLMKCRSSACLSASRRQAVGHSRKSASRSTVLCMALIERGLSHHDGRWRGVTQFAPARHLPSGDSQLAHQLRVGQGLSNSYFRNHGASRLFSQ